MMAGMYYHEPLGLFYIEHPEIRMIKVTPGW